ncbi:MAG TPA: S41 family peptidase [Chloroflexota bacterium]|nr:S41 family peptidase [Chloroflexota bacterium]
MTPNRCAPHRRRTRAFPATLIAALLLLVVAVRPVPAWAAAACGDSALGQQSLDLVEQAYNDFTLLYFEPIPPADVLQPARDAADEAMGTAPETEFVTDWMDFQQQFCDAWGSLAEDASPDAVAHSAIDAMLTAVHEAHTQFYTPTQYQDYLQAQSGDVHYVGIGAQLKGDPLTVQRVFPDSPAEKAGLKFGDKIVAIDGQPASDLDPADAADLIRGEEGTVVRLTIDRPGATGHREIEVRRGAIHVPVIQSRVTDNIGYLQIEDFSSGDLPAKVKAALESLRSQGARGLVLDLRGNPGGRIDVGTAIAGYLLPANAPIYQETIRRGQTVTATASGQRIWDGPIDVLVDEGTASMGEILAAALQEDVGAKLFGVQTAGAVAGSVVLPLADGSAVQITIERIDSAKGTVLNNVGVSPDVRIDTTLGAAGEVVDQPLDAAMSDLRTRTASHGPATAPASTVRPNPQ